MHAFLSSTWETDLPEFEISLIYRVSSSTEKREKEKGRKKKKRQKNLIVLVHSYNYLNKLVCVE